MSRIPCNSRKYVQREGGRRMSRGSVCRKAWRDESAGVHSLGRSPPVLMQRVDDEL